MEQFYLSFPILHSLRGESNKESISHALRHQSVNQKNIIHPIVREEFIELKDVLRSELSWTHYRLLLKLEKEEARQFYMNEAANNNWSTRELERQISSLLFERLSLSKDKKLVNRMAKKGLIIKTPEDLVKDPYVLEFLALEKMEKYYESDLEKALITHLQKFLLELGKGFSFVARQQRITLDGDHFYIDLVFYNRLTRSFMLIDLKVGKLTHGDIGQMQMYVNYYNRTQKTKGENNTIGLLLCAEKNDTVVKYTLPENQKQIFISKYLPYLPTEEELKNEIKKEKQNLQIQLKLRGISE
jgi:predicted nuclease of restriction endonuclease-like (RecB) superfamily